MNNKQLNIIVCEAQCFAAPKKLYFFCEADTTDLYFYHTQNYKKYTGIMNFLIFVNIKNVIRSIIFCIKSFKSEFIVPLIYFF